MKEREKLTLRDDSQKFHSDNAGREKVPTLSHLELGRKHFCTNLRNVNAEVLSFSQKTSRRSVILTLDLFLRYS